MRLYGENPFLLNSIFVLIKNVKQQNLLNNALATLRLLFTVDYERVLFVVK